MNEQIIREQICQVGKRMYDSGFVAANDGNISVRLSGSEIIATPTCVSKGFMTPDMLIKVNGEGEILAANGGYRPSSELKMHLRVYRDRSDVGAVVHAHPPYATSFAIAGIPLNKPIVAEAVVALGCVPIAAYGTPSTNDVPDAIAKYLQHFDAMLLEHHGALSYSSELVDAYHKMESLEFYARLTFMSRQLASTRELSLSQVEELYGIRRKMGIKGRHPGDSYCGECKLQCSRNRDKGDN